MIKTYTITQDQLTRTLEHMNNVHTNMVYEEEYGTVEEYQKSLAEFCAIIGVLCDFGLIREWDKFHAAKLRAEREKENNND